MCERLSESLIAQVSAPQKLMAILVLLGSALVLCGARGNDHEKACRSGLRGRRWEPIPGEDNDTIGLSYACSRTAAVEVIAKMAIWQIRFELGKSARATDW